MHAFLYPTKIWSLNSSVSTLTQEKPKDLESLKEALLSNAVLGFAAGETARRSRHSNFSYHLVRLFDPKFFLLPALVAKWPMEVVVGMNGRVWIKAVDVRVTIAVGRCLGAIDANELQADGLETFLNNMELP